MSKRIKQLLDKYWDDFLHAYWLQPCGGCPGGHSSFWRTVILSPQWKEWQKEQDRRWKTGKIKNGKWQGKNVYDMSEIEESGILGEKHFQDFLSFIHKK